MARTQSCKNSPSKNKSAADSAKLNGSASDGDLLPQTSLIIIGDSVGNVIFLQTNPKVQEHENNMKDSTSDDQLFNSMTKSQPSGITDDITEPSCNTDDDTSRGKSYSVNR